MTWSWWRSRERLRAPSASAPKQSRRRTRTGAGPRGGARAKALRKLAARVLLSCLIDPGRLRVSGFDSLSVLILPCDGC